MMFRTSLVIIALLSLSMTVQAAVIVDFSLEEYVVDFEGGVPTSPIGGPFTATNEIDPAVISAKVQGFGFGTGGSGSYAGELNYASWHGANNRLAIEITIEEGMYVNLESLTINIARNGAGAPEVVDVALASDGIVLDSIGDMVIRNGSEGALPDTGFEHVFDLSAAAKQAGTFTLQLTSSDGKVGNLRINNIVLEGQTALTEGITSKSQVIVYEKGENDTFEVTLQGETEPATPVTVTADPNTPGFASANDIILTSAATPNNTAGNTLDLTFTQVNVPQTVTVSAVEDSPLEEGIEFARISFTITGDEAFADGFISPVDVTIVDADSASVITDLEGDLVLTEGDAIGQTFSVKLGAAPTADVTIIFDNVADPNEVTIVPEAVTFTPANYDEFQNVTVIAVDNDVLASIGTIANPAIERTMINFIITTEDLAYAALPTPAVFGDIFDNECGAWGFNQMDFDQNCYVDMVDFASFASQWLQSTYPQNP